MSSHGSQYKPTIVQYGVFAFIVVSLMVSFHYFATPSVIRGFLLSQFHPEDEKVTLVRFKDGVVASAKAEENKTTGDRFIKVKVEGKDKPDEIPLRHAKGDFMYYADVPVSGDLINKEFIFDFDGFSTREEKISAPKVDPVTKQPELNEQGKVVLSQVEKDGYSKKSGEWYVKCPKLGEEAIMLESWGFFILAFDVGLIFGMILTMMFPPSIGYISQKFEREM